MQRFFFLSRTTEWQQRSADPSAPDAILSQSVNAEFYFFIYVLFTNIYGFKMRKMPLVYNSTTARTVARWGSTVASGIEWWPSWQHRPSPLLFWKDITSGEICPSPRVCVLPFPLSVKNINLEILPLPWTSRYRMVDRRRLGEEGSERREGRGLARREKQLPHSILLPPFQHPHTPRPPRAFGWGAVVGGGVEEDGPLMPLLSFCVSFPFFFCFSAKTLCAAVAGFVGKGQLVWRETCL